jgi:sucrose phosphorylase
MIRRFRSKEEVMRGIGLKLIALYGKKKGVYVLRRVGEILSRCTTVKKKKCVSQKDVILITYGDTIRGKKKPLVVLGEFLEKYVGDSINTVHILPFYPFSSDRGYSVIDYRKVNPHFGNWANISNINKRYKLVFGAVINHVSVRSKWFRNFLRCDPAYQDFFISFERRNAISQSNMEKITRPRTTPLLTKFRTRKGFRYVWTTFGADQPDLNYRNPEVFLEMVKVLLFYAEKGADIIRLDAVAYIWKELGTNCLNRRQVHLIVKLFRDILKLADHHTMLLSEINLPQEQNIAYFGKGTDESHMIYDFALPPLLLYTFYKGNARILSRWASELRVKSDEDFIFNILDSHDGIGLFPVAHILTKNQIALIVKTVEAKGGFVSYRTRAGKRIPYELNITWRSALKDGDEELSIKRYLCSRAIALAMEGIPGVYIQGLMGLENDLDTVSMTGVKRDINRSILNSSKVAEILESEDSKERRVFSEFKKLIRIRTGQKAFHPVAAQKVLLLNDRVFSVLRTYKSETVLALHNVSRERQKVNTRKMSVKTVCDVVSGKKISDGIVLEPYQFMWVKCVR